MTLGKRHKRKERARGRARGRRRGRRLSQSSAIDIGIAIDKKLIKASGRRRTKKKKLQIFSIKGRIVELRAVILTTSSPLFTVEQRAVNPLPSFADTSSRFKSFSALRKANRVRGRNPHTQFPNLKRKLG